MKKRYYLPLVTMITAFSFSHALAATKTWDGGGDGTTWTDGANWDNDTAPVDGDNISISGSRAITDVPQISVTKIVLTPGGGNTISLTGDGAELIISGDTGNDFVVTNGTVTLAGQNSGTFTVRYGDATGVTSAIDGILNINTDAILFTRAGSVLSGAGTVNINSGSTLGVTDVDGITTNASGTVQTTSRTYDASASYVYEPSGAAVTGDGLPSSVAKLTVNPGNGLDLSQSVTVTGEFSSQGGTLNLNGKTLTLNGEANGVGLAAITGSTANSTLVIGGAGTPATAVFSGTITTQTLTMNRTAGVEFQDNVVVENTLTMTSGNITVSANKSVTVGTTSSTGTLTRTSGTIVGVIKRYVPAGTTGVILFPVGTATNYRPATVTFTGATTTLALITGKHTDADGGSGVVPNLDDNGYTINARSNMFWKLEPDVAPGGTYSLDLNYTGYVGFTVNDPTKVRIIKAPTGTTNFTTPVPGTHVNGSTNVASRSGLTSFSDFYLGSNFGDNPLPVELASFEPKQFGKTVKVMWATASETDNAGFELFRSEGNGAFSMIASHVTNDALKGLGNSATGKSYSFTDDQNLEIGKTYTYKLVDVSLDGVRTEKDQKSVEIKDASVFTNAVFPNPAVEYADVEFALGNDDAVTIQISDITGRNIMTIDQKSYKAGINTERIALNGFAQGFYTVRISTAAGSTTQSLVITK